MLETVKNYDVSTRTIQVMFRSVIRSVNTVERKIQKMIILNRKRKKKGIKPHLQPLDLQGEFIILICFQ